MCGNAWLFLGQALVRQAEGIRLFQVCKTLSEVGGEFSSLSCNWTPVRRDEFGVLPGKSMHIHSWDNPEPWARVLLSQVGTALAFVKTYTSYSVFSNHFAQPYPLQQSQVCLDTLQDVLQVCVRSLRPDTALLLSLC